ncbi:MAG TPA: GNAT family N-acetyltransferase, partial [Hyphomonas sp.]|nr:GNAT family N-acetyltransferase [Hyphomonas sp.]
MSAIRSAVFLSEQDCPYEEEFDGNDFCATHLLLKAKGRPVGTLRIRWFAEFAKLERIAL